MTTREHMDNLAQRYARALVRFHMTTDQEDYEIVIDLQNMLNEVCKEMAAEILDNVETL